MKMWESKPINFLKFLSAIFIAISLEGLPRKLINKLKSRGKSDEDFHQYNFPELKQSNSKLSDNLILLDSFSIPHWAVINTVAAQELGENAHSEVATFSFANRSDFEEIMYGRLGVSIHLVVKLNFTTLLNVLKFFFKACKHIWRRNQIIDFEIDGLNIGLDIYESFLRRGHATFDLFSRDLYREVWRGIIEYFYFLPKFEKERITCVMVSHDNYVGPGLLTRIAYKYSVPVLLINPFELNILDKSFQNYERFRYYREYFSSQPISWQQESLLQAREELSSRINGVLGVGTMSYQVKSAFTHHRIASQITYSRDKKLLVLAHDFFDNPHAYSRMLFDDFYKWIDFLARTCLEENIDCYVKLHRDYSDIELKVILDLKKLHPHIVILDSEVSYHQLYEEGIRFVTTCYGSAGHELPLLGFTVINASYNPHIAYSFNYHASSIVEYGRLISEQVDLVIDSDLESEIYEFYSVHSFLMWPDNFNMGSYRDFAIKTQGNFAGKVALAYLASNLDLISEKVLSNLKEALTYRRTFSVERSLQNSLPHRWKAHDSRASLFDKIN